MKELGQSGSRQALKCPWTLARRGWTLRRRNASEKKLCRDAIVFSWVATYCLRYGMRTSVAMSKDDLRRIFDACDREGTLDIFAVLVQ